jgi:hypothetical protein
MSQRDTQIRASCAKVLVGYTLAFAAQRIILPLLAILAAFAEHSVIAAVFTLLIR